MPSGHHETVYREQRRIFGVFPFFLADSLLYTPEKYIYFLSFFSFSSAARSEQGKGREYAILISRKWGWKRDKTKTKGKNGEKRKAKEEEGMFGFIFWVNKQIQNSPPCLLSLTNEDQNVTAWSWLHDLFPISPRWVPISESSTASWWSRCSCRSLRRMRRTSPRCWRTRRTRRMLNVDNPLILLRWSWCKNVFG